MICAACHNGNEVESRFCAQCGQPLDILCPACGHRATAEARFCSLCGQQLPRPAALLSPLIAPSSVPPPTPTLEARLDQLQRYLPAHLADKILAHRGRLAGERKLVTVLCADIAGYTALSAQLGEEALFALMDEVYELLIHEIHRYEGTVHELTGDGLVAFFGAPLAVEQAPQRAVRAALALHAALTQYNTRIESEHGVCLVLRVGINTGPVIVGTIGNNLRMDYKAVGQTVNLAARMEQTATPGTTQITEHTYKLVAGYFECDDLGAASLKGVSGKVQAYRVIGERGGRTRIDVAHERGFTRLVGRERELESLHHGFRLAQEGRGQVVSIIGDAGLGKSRLLYELRQRLVETECTWLEGRCQPYGVALAYGPMVEVLKQYFQIAAHDGAAEIGHKVSHGLTQLSPTLETTTPYFLHLLSAESAPGLPPELSPEAIKHWLFEALAGLLCSSATQRPVVLALEDLHWVDQTTAEFLSALVEQIAGARLFLVCTYRPEFVCTWSRKSYHQVLTLPRLGHADGCRMLAALLETPHIQDDLATLVFAKAEGVPFFLEELVTSLRETGAIEQHAGQWQLTASTTAVPVPDTVEEVLMARIDRLPEGAKHVLQIGAVIGREWRSELLHEVAGLPEHEVSTHLAAITDAELLYRRSVPPPATYLFKHALTQEAAYQSLLTQQRRELHQRVAVTLEVLFPDRLEEYYGQLAQHYLEAAPAAPMTKAMTYAVLAGHRHMALSAYTEAARFYQMALRTLERQEPVDEAQRYPVLLALAEAQRKAGEFGLASETCQRAMASARCQAAADLLAQAALEFAQTTWRGWLPVEPPVPCLQEALHALGNVESALRARMLGSLARALLYSGSLSLAAQEAQEAVAVARLVGEPGVLAYTLGTRLEVFWERWDPEVRLDSASEMLRLATEASEPELMSEAHSRRMSCLLELGDIQAVDATIAAMAQLDERLRQPNYHYITVGLQAMRALLDGRFAEAERLVVQNLVNGPQTQAESLSGQVSLPMFTLFREQGRLPALAPAIRYFVQQHGLASTWRPGLAVLYSELRQLQEARREFEHLAQDNFAGVPRDSLWMGCLTYLTDVCTTLGDMERAATLYELLLPYAGRAVVVGGGAVCYGAVSHYLGMLATTMRRWSAAEEHFRDALALNTRLGAHPWIAHTQYQYAHMLLARQQPGDREQALGLLDTALATAQSLGMRRLETSITGQSASQRPPAPAASAALAELSQREVEVLRLLALGKSNRDIAEALYISLNTVATHVRNILTKTGAANRTEAAAYAMRHGVGME